MAQEAIPAGGDGNPADAIPEANPFEELAAEMTPDEDGDEPEEVDEDEAPEAEPEADEEADDDDEADEPDAPPAIEPPNSLNAEDKEAFKKLPREAQEFTARRIGELEKGFQTKAQEVARQKQDLQLETLKVAEQIKAEAAEQLQRYAQHFEVKPPSAALMQTDPVAYAQQLESFQYFTAQRESAQRDADKARAEQAQYQQARAQHEAQAFRQQLEAELPEIFDPATGQQLAQELNATAELLGFDPNEISDVAAIKALKVTSDWKTKAAKYDALMVKKMERVRSGKNPPPITKPGTARMPEANRKAVADQAWQVALSSKNKAVREDALATWAEKTGWL